MQRHDALPMPQHLGSMLVGLFAAFSVILGVIVDPVAGLAMAAAMFLLDPMLPLDPTRDWLPAMPGWHV